MQHIKSNPELEYRLKRRERIDASLPLAERYPQLKGLKVTLEFPGTHGGGGHVMRCQVNVKQARAELWYGCPGAGCTRGDFDLSAALAGAVEARKKLAEGEVRCPGLRKRGREELEPCRTVLRYKLSLTYEGNKSAKRRAD
jgi:hypothetical protein